MEMEKTGEETAAERPKQLFQIGDFVVHEGRLYKVEDCFWSDRRGEYLYDIDAVKEEKAVFNATEGELRSVALHGRVTVFIVTASGQSFTTEVSVAKSLEKAREVARELFEDLQLDGGDCEEVSTDEWMGYSKRADCVVRISIHEREV